MSGSFAQIWLKEAITIEQVYAIEAVFRELGLEVGTRESKQEAASQITPDPNLLPFIDRLIQNLQSPALHEMATVWREQFNAATYPAYSWRITVNAANLILSLPNDGWRQGASPYEVHLSYTRSALSSDNWFESFRFKQLITTIEWLPVAYFNIITRQADDYLWEYLAWHIMDLLGGRLLRLFNSTAPFMLEEKRPLNERGEFVGKTFAIPYIYSQPVKFPHTDYFMDADFLAAWLDHPDFRLS